MNINYYVIINIMITLFVHAMENVEINVFDESIIKNDEQQLAEQKLNDMVAQLSLQNRLMENVEWNQYDQQVFLNFFGLPTNDSHDYISPSDKAYQFTLTFPDLTSKYTVMTAQYFLKNCPIEQIEQFEKVYYHFLNITYGYYAYNYHIQNQYKDFHADDIIESNFHTLYELSSNDYLLQHAIIKVFEIYNICKKTQFDILVRWYLVHSELQAHYPAYIKRIDSLFFVNKLTCFEELPNNLIIHFRIT